MLAADAKALRRFTLLGGGGGVCGSEYESSFEGFEVLAGRSLWRLLVERLRGRKLHLRVALWESHTLSRHNESGIARVPGDPKALHKHSSSWSLCASLLLH